MSDMFLEMGLKDSGIFKATIFPILSIPSNVAQSLQTWNFFDSIVDTTINWPLFKSVKEALVNFANNAQDENILMYFAKETVWLMVAGSVTILVYLMLFLAILDIFYMLVKRFMRAISYLVFAPLMVALQTFKSQYNTDALSLSIGDISRRIGAMFICDTLFPIIFIGYGTILVIANGFLNAALTKVGIDGTTGLMIINASWGLSITPLIAVVIKALFLLAFVNNVKGICMLFGGGQEPGLTQQLQTAQYSLQAMQGMGRMATGAGIVASAGAMTIGGAGKTLSTTGSMLTGAGKFGNTIAQTTHKAKVIGRNIMAGKPVESAIKQANANVNPQSKLGQAVQNVSAKTSHVGQVLNTVGEKLQKTKIATGTGGMPQTPEAIKQQLAAQQSQTQKWGTNLPSTPH